MDINEDRSICYESYTDPVNKLSTQCGHNFHKTCISIWLEHKPNCPLCRSMLKFVNKKYRNIEIIDENFLGYCIKVLDKDYGIPISFQYISKEDINLIIQQTGEPLLKSVYSFIKNNKNVIDAIMDLY